MAKQSAWSILLGENLERSLGVVSKTDITLCYRHGQDLLFPAGTIMSTPVALCYEQDHVESAIKSMILKDLHRLFVVPEKHQPVAMHVSAVE
ncbi:MAG: CBS domain-containing protein [Desulfobacula sp.]|nr:CBS domain-containing protein [Desulfobacula sp.]